MDIYSRLYKYRDRPSGSPLENFLTEALADIFNRLPMPIQTEFLIWMLPASCLNRLRDKCRDGKQIKAVTQFTFVAAGSMKRPDIIVYLDDEPLILIEAKVNAALQSWGSSARPASTSAITASSSAIHSLAAPRTHGQRSKPA